MVSFLLLVGSFFSVCRGRPTVKTWHFEMDDFATSPTLEKLDRCTKADLILIASFFDIYVPLNACKAEIKGTLSEKLVEKGVVTKLRPQTGLAPEGLHVGVGAVAATVTQALSSQVNVGAEAPTVAQAGSIDPLSLLQAGVDTEDFKLALRLKAVDLETKIREVELMHLKIRDA